MAPPHKRNLPAHDQRGRITLRAANSSSTDRSNTVAARCIELPPPSEQGGGAPEWVELLPAGPEIEGRDGRKWRLDDVAHVALSSYDSDRDIPIDYEHATEIKAPEGEPAPAAGWIKQLQVRGGALWGEVEWTERGRQMVAGREYRYLSPVFAFERESGNIVRLLSAGLTNNPNLRMTALNREGATMNKEILAALGLAEDATDEQVVTAINTLKQERDSAEEKARNSADSSSAPPSLEKFVPRADYDQAVQRAANAEAKVAEAEKQALDNEIEAEITKALEAGKITPATADYHRAQCKAEGGLERFKKYIEAAPEVARNTNLGGTPSGTAAALTGDAAKIASMFGHTAEDLKKYRTSC